MKESIKLIFWSWILLLFLIILIPVTTILKGSGFTRARLKELFQN